MTTDPEEGRRQIEATRPEPLKVGDKVRLKAGGDRVMTVVELEDYGNQAVCEWVHENELPARDTFPARALVRVASEVEAP